MKYEVGIGVAALLCAVAAQAQTEAPATDASRPRAARPVFAPEAAATARPLEPQEREARHFLKQAAASSRFQVDAARLAASRSANVDVLSLASSLGTEQAQAGDELLWLLHQRGLAAPMMENAQRKALQRLARLKGPRFDREYLAAAGGQVQEQAAAGEQASAQVQDPAIGAWIARTLPSLRYQADNAARLSAVSQPDPARGARRVRQRERLTGPSSR